MASNAENEAEPLGEEEVLLSSLLNMQVSLNENIIKAYKERAARIALSQKQTAKETRWLNDYVLNYDRLLAWSTSVVDSESVIGMVGETAVAKTTETVQPQKIELNKLVKTPKAFDGNKPPARQWLDDFEKSSEANGWNHSSMVKFFSTYLEKAANDWFVTIAKRKLGSRPSWPDLRAAFIRHYLGDCDKQTLRRQLEKTYQGENEKATNFIPRLVRLVDMVEPGKPEEDLVDLIRSKLRLNYQDKLLKIACL